jgi:DNA-binding MarR family transcriptional regulator
MSRVVSKLADQELVSRELGPGRTTQLALTRKGRSLYRGLIEVANERDAAFRSVLNPAEQKALEGALAKLTTLARALE